jgi:hypothetical protein
MRTGFVGYALCASAAPESDRQSASDDKSSFNGVWKKEATPPFKSPKSELLKNAFIGGA